LIVLDKLQYLSLEGFNHACLDNNNEPKEVLRCALMKINEKSFPSDIMFRVVSKSFFEPFITAEEIDILQQYNDFKMNIHTGARRLQKNEMDALMTHLTKHVLHMPMEFRRVDSIRILLVGCETLSFIVDFVVALTVLTGWVKNIFIEVVEKNSVIKNKWSTLLIKHSFLSKLVLFNSKDFFFYENEKMREFDVALCPFSNVSKSFALKFVSLAFQPNSRPYFKSAKLFFFTDNLMKLVKNCFGRKNLSFLIDECCLHSKIVEKNIVRLNTMSLLNNPSTGFVFQYHQQFDENSNGNIADENFICNALRNELHLVMVDAVHKALKNFLNHGKTALNSAKVFNVIKLVWTIPNIVNMSASVDSFRFEKEPTETDINESQSQSQSQGSSRKRVRVEPTTYSSTSNISTHNFKNILKLVCALCKGVGIIMKDIILASGYADNNSNALEEEYVNDIVSEIANGFKFDTETTKNMAAV